MASRIHSAAERYEVVMLYSCFIPEKGLYRVYQDSSARQVNGDLPVPKFPSEAGRIGVASIEAKH